MNEMEFTLKYLETLKNKFSGLNLTKITDRNDFQEKQYLDSIFPFENSKTIGFGKYPIVDVGFGGGFPSLPVAYKYPNVTILGIEARRKKVEAVNIISQEMCLRNFKGLHYRLENILFDTPCLISFKAVGKVREFLEKINPGCENIKVLFFKGPSFKEVEIGYDSIRGWKLVEEFNYKIGDNSRTFIVYELEKMPQKNIKNLVKLSGILSNK